MFWVSYDSLGAVQPPIPATGDLPPEARDAYRAAVGTRLRRESPFQAGLGQGGTQDASALILLRVGSQPTHP